jgi:putative transcriptional regulator
MSFPISAKDGILRRIAGDIIFSNEPGTTMRKWREMFGISQTQIAEKLRVSPSVISDYEGGRRRSPGTQFIRKFVNTIVTIDEEEGGILLRQLLNLSTTISNAIIDLREFPIPVSAEKICQVLKGVPLACEKLLDRYVYGYTIVDSVKAILSLSGTDFLQLFGSTTERVAIFTKVNYGRSPMVAVRVNPLKPRVVVIHGPKSVDSLAIKLAELEQIPLVLSKIITVKEVVRSLSDLYRSSASNNTSRH